MTAENWSGLRTKIDRGDVQMNHRFFPRAAFALAACSATALLAASAARSADFSAEYVFGDSLSDNGNLAEIGPSIEVPFANPPSVNGSFTNGPVAVQLLAESLGLSANAALWLTAPAVPAGTNYAVAGATSATPSTGFINLLDQVGAYSAYSADHADPSALYVVISAATTCATRRWTGPARPPSQQASTPN
jgi:phospholipase/lecithinase/hemolysin